MTRRLLRACGLFAAVVAASLASAQQSAGRLYRVGILNEAYAANHPTVEGLKAGLNHLGLIEGRDITFEIRFTEGKREDLQAAAKALVDEGMDLIFTSSEAATLAAKNASKKIPIVFTLVGDPVASGIVASLVRPGSNITGIYDAAPLLTAKRVELLRTMRPALKRVWFIYRSGDPTDKAALSNLEQAVRALKVTLMARAVENSDEIVRVLQDVRPGDALLAPNVDDMNGSGQILQAAIKSRIPVIFPAGGWVTGGGLASYGPDFYSEGVQAAGIVDRVLHGSSAADLPVQTADEFELEVNLNTARLLGITVPPEILFRTNVFRQ